ALREVLKYQIANQPISFENINYNECFENKHTYHSLDLILIQQSSSKGKVDVENTKKFIDAVLNLTIHSELIKSNENRDKASYLYSFLSQIKNLDLDSYILLKDHINEKNKEISAIL